MNTSQQRALSMRHRSRGMTLIELVIAIAVVGIAVSSVLSVMSAQATRSADAMIREQATAIASAYLNEIMQKNFSGPACCTRATFDNVDQYKNLPDQMVRDQLGNPVAGLDQFQVTVDIRQGVLNGLPPGAVKLINVSVSHTSGVSVLMSGYRTNWP